MACHESFVQFFIHIITLSKHITDVRYPLLLYSCMKVVLLAMSQMAVKCAVLVMIAVRRHLLLGVHATAFGTRIMKNI